MDARGWLLLGGVTLAGAGAAPWLGAEEVPTLPLEVGFYVATDTPCAQASNATTHLFRRNGMDGARDYCDFTAVEQTGPGAWRVRERCGEFGDLSTVFEQGAEWTSEDGQSFRRVTDRGWEQASRLCPQSDMPEPWNEADLSNL